MTLEQLCQEIQNKYLKGYSWREIAKGYDINSAMARLIALGYQPGEKIRARLGLVSVCPTCDRPVVRQTRRTIPYLKAAVANLQQLEAAATLSIDPIRVYARGGKRVHIPKNFESK